MSPGPTHPSDPEPLVRSSVSGRLLRPAAPAETDPGAPGALQRVLIRLRRRLEVERMDRIWIFEPVRRRRRESGLVVVNVRPAARRSSVLSLAYTAAETGTGVEVSDELVWLGEAEPELLPQVAQGVARRAAGRGSGRRLPFREFRVDGSEERYSELVAGVGP